MRGQRLVLAITAFLLGSAIAALVLVFVLPVPPTRTSNWPNFGQLMLLTLIGPLSFSWAWGPSPVRMLGLLAAVAMPVASLATLLFGFVRKKSYPALVFAAALWSVFGGFSAFLAVTGSV